MIYVSKYLIGEYKTYQGRTIKMFFFFPIYTNFYLNILLILKIISITYQPLVVLFLYVVLKKEKLKEKLNFNNYTLQSTSTLSEKKERYQVIIIEDGWLEKNY